MTTTGSSPAERVIEAAEVEAAKDRLHEPRPRGGGHGVRHVVPHPAPRTGPAPLTDPHPGAHPHPHPHPLGEEMA